MSRSKCTQGPPDLRVLMASYSGRCYPELGTGFGEGGPEFPGTSSLFSQVTPLVPESDLGADGKEMPTQSITAPLTAPRDNIDYDDEVVAIASVAAIASLVTIAQTLTALAEIATALVPGAPVFFTVSEVARILKMSTRHVRSETAQGILPHKKSGTSVRYSVQNLQTYSARIEVDRW